MRIEKKGQRASNIDMDPGSHEDEVETPAGHLSLFKASHIHKKPQRFVLTGFKGLENKYSQR